MLGRGDAWHGSLKKKKSDFLILSTQQTSLTCSQLRRDTANPFPYRFLLGVGQMHPKPALALSLHRQSPPWPATWWKPCLLEPWLVLGDMWAVTVGKLASLIGRAECHSAAWLWLRPKLQSAWLQRVSGNRLLLDLGPSKRTETGLTTCHPGPWAGPSIQHFLSFPKGIIYLGIFGGQAKKCQEQWLAPLRETWTSIKDRGEENKIVFD